MTDEHQGVFLALADSTRREIMIVLAETSPISATELSKIYPITRQGILKHLNVLEEAGLVTAQKVGRQKNYTFTPDRLSVAEQWIKALELTWDARLMRLKALVEQNPGAPEGVETENTPPHAEA